VNSTQYLFLNYFSLHKGNFNKAYSKSGISSRQVGYWRRDDKEFIQQIDKILHDLKITQQTLFLDKFITCGGEVKKTCEVTGISSTTFYKWRRSDVDFVKQLNSNDLLEKIAKANSINLAESRKPKKPYRKNKSRHIIMHGFAERFDFAMMKREATQVELAKQAGVTQPHIHQLRMKGSFPRLGLAQRLAFMLNVSFKWFKYGKKEFEPFVKTKKYPIEEFIDTFGERLTFFMWIRGLSPVTLAQKIGFSTTAIQHWQEGERRPSERSIEALLKFFNVSYRYLDPDKDFTIGYTKNGKAIWYAHSRIMFIENERRQWLREVRDDLDKIRQELEEYKLYGESKWSSSISEEKQTD